MALSARGGSRHDPAHAIARLESPGAAGRFPAAGLDAAAGAAALDGDGATWTYLPYGPLRSEDEYRHWLVTTCLGDDPLFFVIVDAATGKAVGQASYLNIKPSQGSIEVGHVYFSPLM